MWKPLSFSDRSTCRRPHAASQSPTCRKTNVSKYLRNNTRLSPSTNRPRTPVHPRQKMEIFNQRSKIRSNLLCPAMIHSTDSTKAPHLDMFFLQTGRRTKWNTPICTIGSSPAPAAAAAAAIVASKQQEAFFIGVILFDHLSGEIFIRIAEDRYRVQKASRKDKMGSN